MGVNGYPGHVIFFSFLLLPFCVFFFSRFCPVWLFFFSLFKCRTNFYKEKPFFNFFFGNFHQFSGRAIENLSRMQQSLLALLLLLVMAQLAPASTVNSTGDS
jgi:hypothetical protein